MIYNYGTPVLLYKFPTRTIAVKRDDKVCTALGAPQIGKLRAMDRIIRSRPEYIIGVVDRSVNSRASDASSAAEAAAHPGRCGGHARGLLRSASHLACSSVVPKSASP